MRCLITGVTGQDGWYLSEILLGQGHDVFGLVTPGDTASLHPGVRALPGDLRDLDSLRGAVAAADPDETYNLAAISSVAQSWRTPDVVADVTGVGAVRLIAALRELDAGRPAPTRLVHASSAEVFGAAPAPQDESTPIRPTTPYGAAKALAHHTVEIYRGAGAWAAAAVLFSHESPRRPAAFVARKIALGVAAIAGGDEQPLVLGDLDVRRDWGYARDYADAMVRIARHDVPLDFVIATGESHSIGEFVAAAFAHAGIEDWQRHVQQDAALLRAGDAPEQRGNATRARSVLGWAPSVDFAGLVGLLVDAARETTAQQTTLRHD